MRLLRGKMQSAPRPPLGGYFRWEHAATPIATLRVTIFSRRALRVAARRHAPSIRAPALRSCLDSGVFVHAIGTRRTTYWNQSKRSFGSDYEVECALRPPEKGIVSSGKTRCAVRQNLAHAEVRGCVTRAHENARGVKAFCRNKLRPKRISRSAKIVTNWSDHLLLRRPPRIYFRPAFPAPSASPHRAQPQAPTRMSHRTSPRALPALRAPATRPLSGKKSFRWHLTNWFSRTIIIMQSHSK